MKSGTNINKEIAIVSIVTNCIVYETTVSTTNQTNTCFGSAEGDYKRRCNKYILSFRSKAYKHRTELPKEQ